MQNEIRETDKTLLYKHDGKLDVERRKEDENIFCDDRICGSSMSE